MNDPGLDNAIGETEQEMEKDVEKEQEEVDAEEEELLEEEEDFLRPNRWWFAATAFPLVAGTFGPVANAMSICALVQNWRVAVPPGTSEVHGIDIKDPPWLLVVNAISLVFAVIANGALLLNMARKLKFAIAQPITIIFWFLAAFLLIGLTIAAPLHARLPQPPAHALTQAYYYAIIAAVLYFIITLLLLLNVIGAIRGYYPREFKLTTAQRTLMLQTIILMAYLLIGAAVFAEIEGWKYLDAVFWADVTLLTVGFGSDFTPKTHTGRALLFPYSIGGILTIGLIIGSIRSLLLERGKRKMGMRMVEKQREKVLRDMDPEKRRRALRPLGRSKKHNLGATKTELERRKKEYELMREIIASAERNRRWTSFWISASLWLILWLVGAAVFHVTERLQGWSYFQSIYFAFVALLTIGYGDFVLLSNSGRPFFLIWSLLAIPTMTMLISNMGDTIVKGVQDVTLWIGKYTLLPEDGGLQQAIKLGAGRIAEGHLPLQQSKGGAADSQDNDEKGDDLGNQQLEGLNNTAKGMEQDELSEEKKAHDRGDKLAEDEHHLHRLLIEQITKVMNHMIESPPRHYSYDEWAYFLRLLGEDEKKMPGGEPERKEPEKNVEGGNKAADQNVQSEIGFQTATKGEGQWSWLDLQSPLMGTKSEPQWVMERLCATLKKSLEKKGEPRNAREGAKDLGGETEKGAGNEQHGARD